MQLKYDAEAKEKKIYVVGSCGFDSVPCDVGQALLAEKMEGDVNQVETYLTANTPDGVAGASINYATYESAVHGFAHAGELGPLRKKLFGGKGNKPFV